MGAIDYVEPGSEKISADCVAYHGAHLRNVAGERQYSQSSFFNVKVRLGV
jgi:hypothetical protein